MQARFTTPSSLAAHHRRLMASCAESGCPQVRQRPGATLSARTVGESLCMSKSVEAHYKGEIVSARDLPIGCQQQCSLVVPTVRAPRCLTEPSAKSPQKLPTKRPEREWLMEHAGRPKRADRSRSGSALEVLLGVLRLVDHLVVGLLGRAVQVGAVNGPIRVVLTVSLPYSAARSALLVVLGLLGRLI